MSKPFPWILASASTLAGTVTAFCGPIAFIGVAVRHLCRSLFNTSDRQPAYGQPYWPKTGLF